MGFIDENPNKHPTVFCRIVVAAFLVLMILLVVLLTCLLEIVRINQSNPQSLSQTTPSKFQTTPAIPPVICPSLRPGLVSFPQGTTIALDSGVNYILDRNVSVNTIMITNGASLTVIDNGTSIFLRTKNILIDNQGALLIGAENCPHMSPLEILLDCMSNDTEVSSVFGRKFIGVAPTGSIDIHGPWKLSWTFLRQTLNPNDNNLVVTLADSHQKTWKAGDRIVIASSDYDMNHAEEFNLLQCDSCADDQIKIDGPVKYRHVGAMGQSGVDMRAEVGILTRNIKIHGKMENSCYGDNMCQFFDNDTFGGTTHVLHGVRVARFEGIELFNMGQQVLGRYPIHFHRVFDSYGNYARQLSIHNCFSRCVTIHATMGLLVEDVVGYNTIGHCFFLEDGLEMYNNLTHNLALVSKPGTLLPSDRDDNMCISLTANASVYVPDPANDCNGVSNFWISHPMNYLTNNSAGGSVYGFFYIFHRIPTGPSEGMLPPFHGERSPLGSFVGNRAHSSEFGFFLDRGVKVDQPSATDPRDFLALIDLERYQPHVDRNLSLPRAPAHIVDFTGYMNQIGMFVRGGDVWIENAMLSDNDVGVTMSSSPSLPYDQGSHQELVNSVVTGESSFNSSWSSRSVPCVGVEIRDGPILIKNNLFYSFPKDPNRLSYAIGFFPNNSGQSSPANIIAYNNFVNVDQDLFFGQVGGLAGSYFGNYSLDGDLTQIVGLIDVEGEINGLPSGYALRLDSPLIKNDNSCIPNGTFMFCDRRDFGQLFVNVSSKRVKFSITDTTTQSGPLILSGVDLYDNQHPTTTQFQPVLIANHTYRINWVNGAPPSSLNFSLCNFNMNSFIRLEICYPPSTNFISASLFLLDQAMDTVTRTASVPMASDYSTLNQNPQEAQYFWNSTMSVLYVMLRVTWQSPGYSYCAPDGCHFFNVVANVTTSGPYTCAP